MSGPFVIDLAADTTPARHVEADVCIIGAGAAGLYLTDQLASRGKRVVLLEAGPATSLDTDAAGFRPDFDAAPYAGAIAGRFFGIGGTTTHWGGLLVPHSGSDIRETEPSSVAWLSIVAAVTASAPAVLARLGYAGGADFETSAARLCPAAVGSLGAAGFRVLAALHLPFRRKNLASLVTSSRGVEPQIYVGAVASSWQMTHGGGGARAVQLKAVSLSANTLTVSAVRYVVAAGAIETARILLDLDDETPVLARSAAVGRYLTDHLSAPIAAVPTAGLEQTARLFGPRFSGPWMRSFRFLDRTPLALPARAFAHFSFADRSVGFEVARKGLQALQQRRLPKIGAGELIAGTGDLARLAYARLAKSRLHIPRGTAAELQLDIEQTPLRENGIRLTGRKDRYGRRIPAIRWQIGDQDRANLAQAAARILALWPTGARDMPALAPLALEASGANLHDAYHPAGTCRMGEDDESVVDNDLRVRGASNIYVASTGVLPSAGTANPTFTMLCLTHRLGEYLSTLQ